MDEIEDLPTRWEIELEFVQSLANTQYLAYLAQQGYFQDEQFLNYLNYLNYWKDPKFSKFLVYPNCLHILTLLQNDQFKMNLLNQNFTNVLYNDMVELWKEPMIKDDSMKLDEQNNQVNTQTQDLNQDQNPIVNDDFISQSNNLEIKPIGVQSLSISPSSASVSPSV